MTIYHLEGIYNHTLDNLDEIYQEAAELFQLVLTNLRRDGVPPLDFAFAESDPVDVPPLGQSEGFRKPRLCYVLMR